MPDHELLKQIGSGSYGEVWLARAVTGAFRAVKVVYRDSFEQDKPYEREFAGLQKFEPISRAHEGHVDILHVGRNDTAGYFFYVMELADAVVVPGAKCQVSGNEARREETTEASPDTSHLTPDTYVPRTLRHDLRTRGPLPVDDCVSIALALTRAVAHLHRHGLVHRDIKPSNIIFVAGAPKLADIGLVTGIDATRSFVGTDGYIPPEGPGTPQADLYSLGKVLYEISTGKDRQDFPELPSEWRASEERERLLEFNEIVLRACEGDVRQRYPSAQQLEADLALLQRGQSVKARRTTQRRLALTKKLSIAAAALTLLVTGVWLLVNRLNVSTMQRLNALPPVTEITSLAILPFGSESKYLSDAMTCEGMQAFTNIAGLRVAIPPKSRFVANATNADPRRAGEQLGVATVLAGSINKSNQQLHIAARLIRVADGSNLWSAVFDREDQEIGPIQSEVVREVARRLKLSIDDRALRRLETNLMRKLGAYQLYTEGRTIPLTTENELNRSIELLNRAIVEDPDFGQAYAFLALAYTETSQWMLPPKHAMTAAKQNALRALQLDDGLVTAHIALGNVLFYHELDFAKGEAELRLALEVDPSHVAAHAHYARLLLELGRFEEADQLLKQGEQIDPKAQVIHGVRCWRFFLDHRFDDALRAATNYLTFLPNNVFGLIQMGRAQERLGRYDDALATAQKIMQLSPDLDSVAFLGLVHARLGNRGEAQKALDDVRVMSQSSGGSGIFSAKILLALGDYNEAIEHLQRAVEDYLPTALRLKTDPLWDEVRSDPRFQALLQQAGLGK